MTTASRNLSPGRRIRTWGLAWLFAAGTMLPIVDMALAEGPVNEQADTSRTGSGFEISVTSVEELTGLTAVIAGAGEGVNLRATPAHDAGLLASIPDGSTVALRVDMVDTVLDGDGVTRWWPVTFDGQDGWVSGFYLSDGSTPDTRDASVTPAATVQTSAPVVPAEAGEPFDFTEQATESSTARIAGSGESVNVRAEPAVESAVVAIAADGQVVTLRIAFVDTVYDADGVTRWWPITIDGTDGWVSGFYLTSSDGAAPTDSSSSTTTFPAGSYVQAATGDGDGVNIRSQGSPDAETVGTLADGEVVQVMRGPVSFESSVAGWYEITTGAVTGFVDGDLVTATTQPAPPAKAPEQATATPSTTTPPVVTSPGQFAVGDYVAVRSVSGAGVNVRESASMTAGVVGFRADNSILRVTEGPVTDAEGGAWYRVNDGEIDGFIVANLLIASVAPTEASDGTEGTAGQPQVTPRVTPPVTATVTPAATEAAESTSTFTYPLTTYTRTQGFGCSSLGFYPYSPDFGCNIHDGLDLAAPSGTPILAAGSGTVVTAGWCDCGLGYYVEIDHGDGLHTLYGHMAQQPYVSTGQQVNQGDVIGPVGSTGISTGPHVHFMVRLNDVAQDPENYLP